jgi:hypothetical protein
MRHLNDGREARGMFRESSHDTEMNVAKRLKIWFMFRMHSEVNRTYSVATSVSLWVTRN